MALESIHAEMNRPIAFAPRMRFLSAIVTFVLALPLATAAQQTPRLVAARREGTPVTGGPSAITFSKTVVQTAESFTMRFSGSLTGNNVTGTFSVDVSTAAGANPRRSGTTSITVTFAGPPR